MPRKRGSTLYETRWIIIRDKDPYLIVSVILELLYTFLIGRDRFLFGPVRPFRKLIQASSFAPPPVQPVMATRTYSKIKTDRKPCRKFTQERGVSYEKDLALRV